MGFSAATLLSYSGSFLVSGFCDWKCWVPETLGQKSVRCAQEMLGWIRIESCKSGRLWVDSM